MSLLLLAVLSTSVAAEVKVLPQGVPKEFACTSTRTDFEIHWGVNGTPATNTSFQNYIVLGEEVLSPDGGKQKNLTFTANARANNTHIACSVVGNVYNGELMLPVNMTLTLQGHVSAPAVTYEISSDNHSVLFSWSAPFTLNISDMEPDILHYVVYIIRDDGHDDTVNTTDTHYELQADPCQSHQYHVEIAAVNVVGEGEKYRSLRMNLEGYAVAGLSDSRVSFNGRLVLIQITLETIPNCHEVDFVVKYEVELIAYYSRDRHMVNFSGNAGQHILHLNSNDSVKTNERYDCVVRIEGLPNSQSPKMELRTFDVQNFSTTINDQHSGYIDVTCYFAEGSNAKGCRIVAQTQNNAAFCEFFATREDRNESTVTVALPSGTYTFFIYDDEEGADNNPAFTLLSVNSSAQVSECAAVQHNNTPESGSKNNVMLIVILASVSSIIILIAVIVTAIALTCVCKHKGKKQLQSDIEWNDYTSVSVQQSPSSESIMDAGQLSRSYTPDATE